MKRLLFLALVFTFSARAADRLSDADVARGLVNLARMEAIAFQLQFRLAANGNLDIGTTPHARAVALQLRDDELVDPWGTPYRIDASSPNFRVIGAGSDHKFNPEEWPVTGSTFSLESDSVLGPGLPTRQNYTYLARMLDKIDMGFALYEPPDIVPLDHRDSAALLADPHAALHEEQRWECARIALRHGELEEMRSSRTLASMQLLASRLDAWHKAHGSFAALAGKDVIATLRSQPWAYNDWLVTNDDWGAPLRIEIVDGKSYRIASAGSDPKFEQVIVDGRVTQSFDRLGWQKKEMARIAAADRGPSPLQAHDGTMAYRVGGDVTAPIKRSGADPEYPESLRAQKVGGMVLLELVIDESGHVADVQPLLPGNPQIIKSAVDAVKRWEYRPATLGGKPVRSIFNLTVMMRPNE
jgi:TonB family protein